MLLRKIRDFMDTSVDLVILMDSTVQVADMMHVISSIGSWRCNYQLHVERTANYIMELHLPYNRYLAMMKGLQKRGWNLKMETKVGVLNRMIRIEL